MSISHMPRRVLPPFFVATFLLACSEEPSAPERTPPSDTDPAETVGLDDWIDVAGGARIPFADSEVFFEYNATDDDLGFQLFLDAEAWNRVVLLDPDRTRILDFKAKAELEELGLTELRFESAEPSPEEVLALFAPGEYLFRGRTVDGDALIGSGYLSHDLAPTPVFVHPGEGATVPAEDLVLEWEPIAGVAGFEVILVNEDSGASMSVELGGEASTLEVPGEFLEGGTEYKAEVLSIAENGNKTITELTFVTK